FGTLLTDIMFCAEFTAFITTQHVMQGYDIQKKEKRKEEINEEEYQRRDAGSLVPDQFILIGTWKLSNVYNADMLELNLLGSVDDCTPRQHYVHVCVIIIFCQVLHLFVHNTRFPILIRMLYFIFVTNNTVYKSSGNINTIQHYIGKFNKCDDKAFL
ncbi:hypothetical protein ACJX0J_018971, partial [Zea mays]